jgi:hypothetical protein
VKRLGLIDVGSIALNGGDHGWSHGRACIVRHWMSAFGGKADIVTGDENVRFWPKADINRDNIQLDYR